MDLMSSIAVILIGLLTMRISKIEKDQKELIDKVDSLRRMISDSYNRVPFYEDDLHE